MAETEIVYKHIFASSNAPSEKSDQIIPKKPNETEEIVLAKLQSLHGFVWTLDPLAVIWNVKILAIADTMNKTICIIEKVFCAVDFYSKFVFGSEEKKLPSKKLLPKNKSMVSMTPAHGTERISWLPVRISDLRIAPYNCIPLRKFGSILSFYIQLLHLTRV